MEWRCEGSQRVTEVRWDRGRHLSSWDAWRHLILCGVCRTTFWCVIKLQARPVFYFLFMSLRVSNVWIQLSTLTTLTRRCPLFLFIDKNAVLNYSFVSFHGFTKRFSATIISVYFCIYYLFLLCLRNNISCLSTGFLETRLSSAWTFAPCWKRSSRMDITTPRLRYKWVSVLLIWSTRGSTLSLDQTRRFYLY